MTNIQNDEDDKRIVFFALIIAALAIAAFLIPSPPDEVPAIELEPQVSGVIRTAYAAENHIKEPLKMVVDKPVDMGIPDLHPNLKVICKCESAGFPHKDSEGVLLSGFIDSDDKGECQINTRYHGDTMKAQGLDINDDVDYRTYANRLYAEQGRQPWMASSACWAPIIGY